MFWQHNNIAALWFRSLLASIKEFSTVIIYKPMQISFCHAPGDFCNVPSHSSKFHPLPDPLAKLRWLRWLQRMTPPQPSSPSPLNKHRARSSCRYVLVHISLPESEPESYISISTDLQLSSSEISHFTSGFPTFPVGTGLAICRTPVHPEMAAEIPS